MPRTSFRGLTLVLILILILGLGAALPAVAGPAERTPATEDGLLVRLWNRVEHLWRATLRQPDQRPTVAPSSSCSEADRGILIDPNGNSCT